MSALAWPQHCFLETVLDETDLFRFERAGPLTGITSLDEVFRVLSRNSLWDREGIF